MIRAMVQIFDKWPSLQSKVIIGIFFEIEIFISKYVWDYSESIPIKKISAKTFFVFAIFSTCDPIFRKNGYVKS